MIFYKIYVIILIKCKRKVSEDMYKNSGDLKYELFFEEERRKTLLYLHKYKKLLENEDYYYAYEFLMKKEIAEMSSWCKCEDTKSVRCGIDLALDVEVLDKSKKIDAYKNTADKMVRIINRYRTYIKE